MKVDDYEQGKATEQFSPTYMDAREQMQLTQH